VEHALKKYHLIITKELLNTSVISSEEKSNEVKEMLLHKIERAANNLQFEEAGRIKGILDNLDLALFKQDVENENYGDIDIFNYAITDHKICFTVLFYLNGKTVIQR
jgi:excinuclease UvrABC nuclease subunit